MSINTTDDLEMMPAMQHPTVPFFRGTTPVPPSVNMSYKLIKMTREDGGSAGMRMGPTPTLEKFKADAALMLSQAEVDWSLVNAIREAKRKTPLKVVVHVYFREEWRRDLDGVIKYAIDAAFKRMELNDHLVTTLVATKHVDPLQPRVEIEVSCDLSSR